MPPQDNLSAAPADFSSLSDEELVARARQKDFGAFEELLERYEDKVFRLAYRFVRNESEAKEILQDTFLSIWRKLDTFKGDSLFSSWVYRVAANTALMRLRSQRRHPQISTEDLPAGLPRQLPPERRRGAGASAVAGRELGQAPRRAAAVGRAAPPHPGRGRRAPRALPNRLPGARRRGPVDRGDRRGARHLGPVGEDPTAPSANRAARSDREVLRSGLIGVPSPVPGDG